MIDFGLAVVVAPCICIKQDSYNVFVVFQCDTGLFIAFPLEQDRTNYVSLNKLLYCTNNLSADLVIIYLTMNRIKTTVGLPTLFCVLLHYLISSYNRLI